MTKITTLQDNLPRLQRDHAWSGLLALSLIEQLNLEADLTDVFKTADEILNLRQIRDALKLATEAVNERLEDLNEVQYEHMIDNEMQSFNRKGQVLYLKQSVYARSTVGYDDEDLIEWLSDNGLGDLAKAKVNAQSFGAAVRELMKTENQDGSEEYDESKLPEGWDALLQVTRVGEVGIRKAGK